MKRISIRKIAETSVLVSLAVVIDLLMGLIPFLRMPEGGHVSIAMLAIIVNGFRNGWKYGLVGGLIFALINWIFGGYTLHWGSIFLDYLIPFTAFGLSGFFQKQGKSVIKFSLIILLLGLIRYISSSLSGVLFFKEYAYVPDYLNWNLEGEALYWIYSFVIYNLPYISLSTILSIIVGIILHKRNLIYTL